MDWFTSSVPDTPCDKKTMGLHGCEIQLKKLKFYGML